jgi:hypothetical protein
MCWFGLWFHTIDSLRSLTVDRFLRRFFSGYRSRFLSILPVATTALVRTIPSRSLFTFVIPAGSAWLAGIGLFSSGGFRMWGFVCFVVILVVFFVEKVLEFIHGIADIGEVEEGILCFTNVDKRSIHPLNNALHAPQVNRTYMAFLVRNFEKDFGEAVILGYCNTQFVGCCIDYYFLFHQGVYWPMSYARQVERREERGQRRGRGWNRATSRREM